MLRRELLCRCPVALAARLLQRAERSGCDPAALAPNERASLAFQQRALATELPVLDVPALVAAAACLREAGHGSSESCAIEGCLACSAIAHLEETARRAIGEPVPTG